MANINMYLELIDLVSRVNFMCTARCKLFFVFQSNQDKGISSRLY